MLSLRLAKSVTSLPVSVAQIAGSAGISRPVSLRAMLADAGTRTRHPRVCVLRYQWLTPRAGGMFAPPWPDAFYNQVLGAPNGWSLHDYRYRVTDGLVDVGLDLQGWRMLPADQAAPDSQNRGKLVEIVKNQARADGIPIDSYDHVVAFLYPGNNNAGAYGSDAIFDQSPFSLEFYQHEMGHVLGYSHAFGPHADYEYEDNWCVMGFSERQDHAIPAPAELAAVVVDNPPGFWRSGRRLSTAALFHYGGSTDFASTSSVLGPDLGAGPQTIALVAASESHLHDPTLALIATEDYQLTIEYRVPTADDAGIRSAETTRAAVIVHSIGRRSPLRWSTTQTGIWLEAEIPAAAHQDAWIMHGWDDGPGDVHIEILDASADRVTLRVTRAAHP